MWGSFSCSSAVVPLVGSCFVLVPLWIISRVLGQSIVKHCTICYLLPSTCTTSCTVQLCIFSVSYRPVHLHLAHNEDLLKTVLVLLTHNTTKMCTFPPVLHLKVYHVFLRPKPQKHIALNILTKLHLMPVQVYPQSCPKPVSDLKTHKLSTAHFYLARCTGDVK